MAIENNRKATITAFPQWLEVHRFSMLFIGALMLVGAFLPWVEVGLQTTSGFEMLLGGDSIPAQVSKAIPFTSLILTLVLLIALIHFAIGIAGFVKPELIVNHNAVLFSGLTVATALCTLLVALPFNADVLGKNVAFGMWVEVLALTLGFVLSLYLLVITRVDEDPRYGGAEILYPLGFLTILGGTILVNYLFINFELIPKATEIVQRLSP